MEEVGWIGVVGDLNDGARSRDSLVPEPILISTNRVILAGFGVWRSALIDGRNEIPCIEYQFDEEESLRFILGHHQPRRGWNDFVRIHLALALKSSLQQKALDNMRAGGKHKGLANLPNAQRIDVRQEIADIAAVGSSNVSKVETILKTAHPQLIVGLQNGTVKIDPAWQFCKLPRAKQLEEFIRFSEERAINKVIRHSIPAPKKKRVCPDNAAVLDALRRQEAQEPGSVAVRVGRQKRTIVLIGEDLSAELFAQQELKLK
jgi:hypothetical protein